MNSTKTLPTPVARAFTPPRHAASRHRHPETRSIPDLLEPLEILAANSVNLIANHGARFHIQGRPYEIPRYLFIGPKGGGTPIRIGIFATIHGDEPEGAHGLIRFIQRLERFPELARDYCLFLYPICNPTGYEDNTRYSRRGRDLNREFWNHSSEPEVDLLQFELWSHAFDGIIALHSDDTSDGAYGFVNGATLTRNLLEPALAAANRILPRNNNPVIDGFEARNGVIRQGYQGVLGAPPRIRPRPFEIVFETPQQSPAELQHEAVAVALETILGEYRRLIAYAANL